MHDIDHATIGDLAGAFRAIFDRADKDQWELARIAFIATNRPGTKVEDFAGMVGKPPDTITKYRIAYGWRRRNLHDQADCRFGDAAALLVLEGTDGISLKAATQAHHQQAVDGVRELIRDHPALMVEALRDNTTYEAIASQAFDAKRNEIVGAAERIAKEAVVGGVQTESVKTRLAVFQGNSEGSMSGIARDLQEDWSEMSVSDREAVRHFIKRFEVRLRSLRIAARF
jgi:hypothetical protein